jgi:predicted dithiol-disulfide oxidoreductase (DUF899 family)
MANSRISELEQQLYELTNELNTLKRQIAGTPVPDYTFATLDGEQTLSSLFAGRERLLVIHNMGQACRYCTLWADGFNGFLPHLESAMSVVLVSKDDPQTQQAFAGSRGWRFRMASHGGGAYIKEQAVKPDSTNMPGAVAYRRDGDDILRLGHGEFGPGDLYCSLWNLLGVAGLTEEDWVPQYRYWQVPDKMEDGGENLID